MGLNQAKDIADSYTKEDAFALQIKSTKLLYSKLEALNQQMQLGTPDSFTLNNLGNNCVAIIGQFVHIVERVNKDTGASVRDPQGNEFMEEAFNVYCLARDMMEQLLDWAAETTELVTTTKEIVSEIRWILPMTQFVYRIREETQTMVEDITITALKEHEMDILDIIDAKGF